MTWPATLPRGGAVALIAAFLLALPARAEAPKVVASILPVHALVAAVMEGVGKPTLLIRGAASPHAFALRPSDARALAEADAVFWIGPRLETVLIKALASLAPDARRVALIEADGVRVLKARRGGVWREADVDGQKAQGHGGAGHEGERRDDHAHEGAIDPHVWLDPANARAMVRRIAAVLGELDPANAGRYRANARVYDAHLAALDRVIAAETAAVGTVPYIVFHDAYHYFEARYGLAPAGALTVSPDRPPGARRLIEIRARIRATGAPCVFAEPQFTPRLVATVVEGTGARAATLDPLGASLAPGPRAYHALMRALARDLVRCLAGPG